VLSCPVHEAEGWGSDLLQVSRLKMSVDILTALPNSYPAGVAATDMHRRGLRQDLLRIDEQASAVCGCGSG